MKCQGKVRGFGDVIVVDDNVDGKGTQLLAAGFANGTSQLVGADDECLSTRLPATRHPYGVMAWRGGARTVVLRVCVCAFAPYLEAVRFCTGCYYGREILRAGYKAVVVEGPVQAGRAELVASP